MSAKVYSPSREALKLPLPDEGLGIFHGLPNISVGARRPILEILHVCLRLTASPRLPVPSELQRETLDPRKNFEALSIIY